MSAYILSVITIYLWEKIPASVKRHGQENLRFSRGKLIISSIGWITTGSIFLHYLSGVYLGTSRLPLLIKGVFFINEVLEIIFFPFALLTYLLFKANGLALVTLSTITQTPLNIGGVSHPSGLTGFGAFIIIGLIIGEWYILSSLMIYLWDKIRRKFKRVNS
jgi:hypothetical protein